MLTRICPRCGQNKGINYYIRIETDDGKPYYNVCKDCRQELACGKKNNLRVI
jgi:hypothetical protein